MNKINVVVFGHGQLAIELVKYIKKFKNKFNLYCVFLSSNSSMFENSLEHYCISKKILCFKKLNVRNLKKINTPLIGLSCLYDRILQKEEIKCFDIIINSHLSFLPSFRGLNPVNWSIKEKKKMGFTLHTIEDNKIDLGKVLIRKKINKISENIFDNTLLLEKEVLKHLKIVLKKYPLINFLDISNSVTFSKKKYYNKDDFSKLGLYAKKFFFKQKYYLKKKIKNKSYLIIDNKIDLNKIDRKNYYLFFHRYKGRVLFRENIRFFHYKSLSLLKKNLENLASNNVIFDDLFIYNKIHINSKLTKKIVVTKNK